MASTKNQKKRGSSSGKKGTGTGRKGKNTRSASSGEGFQDEILLLVLLAVCALIMIGNLGMGGGAGRVISGISFGSMGMMAYVFPIVLFLGAAFMISNKHNPLAYKKTAAGAVFFVFSCGILQLLTEGYVKSSTLLDYYNLSADYHTGGGLLGGAVCISTASAFGEAGSWIIVCVVLMVCLILITQRSFFGFMGRILDGITGLIRGGQERYREGQPERDLKKEIREKERHQRRMQRQKALEEELEQLEEEAEEETAEETEELTAVNAGGTEGKTSRRRRSYAGAASDRVRTRKFQTPPVLDAEDFRAYKKEAENEEEREAGDDPVFSVSADSDPKVPEAEAPDEDMKAPNRKKAGKKGVEFRIHRSEMPPSYEDEEEEFSDFDKEEEDAFVPAGNSRTEDEEMPADLQEAETEASVQGKEERRQPRRNPRSSREEIASGIEHIQQEIGQREEGIKREYQYPPLKLLKKGDGRVQGDSDEYLRETAEKLQETLQNFGVNVTVTNVSCGPTVTRYELQPEKGVKVSRIVGLSDDIKLNLAAADIRIEAPIPGKAAVGIEVPNRENSPVMLRDLLQSPEFQKASSRVSFAVGKDIAGKPIVADIAKMPHLLIAGATGSGKSVCINTLIISLLYKASPEEVKLIMVDPKVVELSVYNGIPHLLIPVVTDPKKAAGALNWAVTEMNSRYNTFAEYRVRNLSEYNKKTENMTIPEGETRPEKFPQIVIIVDELADLMMVAPGEVEDSICRLAQLARAAGIHLIIATQRPSVNVITGLIKANMPSRIAFSVSSGVDSRTILDMHGAEKLLGKGDMLFYPQGYQRPARLQGAFVSDEEVSSIVEYLKEKNPVQQFSSGIVQQMTGASPAGGGADERDTYFEQAGKFIIDKEKASIGMLQRMFKIGFNRAARIMDQLADAGVVGPEEGTKPRRVLMTMEEFQTYIEENL